MAMTLATPASPPRRSSLPLAGAAEALPSLAAVPLHGFQGRPPVQATVSAFNRERTGRIKYTVTVRFEGQEWRVFRYYTDFVRLRNKLECSQYLTVASDLPPKHPLRLKLRMKLSLSKRRGMRKEMGFIAARMANLERWLNRLLEHTGPLGLFNVRFLDDFFEAFPDDEDYNRVNARGAHVCIDKSMFHALKSMGVQDQVYNRLWRDGYSFESLAELDSTHWVHFGVSRVLAELLFDKFSARRRRASEVATQAIARAASIAFPIDLARPHPLTASYTAPTRTNVPPPYSPMVLNVKRAASGAPHAMQPSAPPVPCRSRKPSTASVGSDTGSGATAPPIQHGHGLTPILGSPPDADVEEVRRRQRRALEACALLSRHGSLH